MIKNIVEDLVMELLANARDCPDGDQATASTQQLAVNSA